MDNQEYEKVQKQAQERKKGICCAPFTDFGRQWFSPLWRVYFRFCLVV